MATLLALSRTTCRASININGFQISNTFNPRTCQPYCPVVVFGLRDFDPFLKRGAFSGFHGKGPPSLLLKAYDKRRMTSALLSSLRSAKKKHWRQGYSSHLESFHGGRRCSGIKLSTRTFNSSSCTVPTFSRVLTCQEQSRSP